MGYIRNRIISMFYKKNFVNYRRRTSDTKEFFTEGIVEFLCNHIDEFKNRIPTITSESTYKAHGHDGIIRKPFKIYMSDVGLLRKHSHLATSAFAENNRLFTEFKGALTENFVLQSLSRQFETAPRYWTETPYEVDFVVQLDNDIIPVECKAGTNVRATSLKKYSQQYQEQTPIMVRFSLMNLSFDGKVLNIPLFLADRTVDLVRLALSRNA